jgi:predicted nucleic acid-binding Zn ribbon protein
MSDDHPGVEAWKEQTSAFDRVRSVAGAVSKARPVSYIATEAHVAENTARDHLERLVDMNVLLRRDVGGTAMYEPDPLHTRVQTLRDLLDEYDHDGLLQLKAELQEQVETWNREYGVGSPEALRERAAETDDAAETREIQQTANDWALVRYRLDIVEQAIENYTAYSRDSPAPA